MAQDGSKATLDRALSKLGFASRSAAIQMIRSGRVRVGGKVIKDPEHWVRWEEERIEVDGSEVKAARKAYLALHKPRRLVTTLRDEKGRPTVYDCLGEFRSWVFPIGRLDRDTSGLLLFTNDTAFGDAISDPKTGLPKTYIVKIRGRLDAQALERLKQGIDLGNGVPTLPASVREIRPSEKGSWLEVTIVEGRNRQIRRMFEALGQKAERLLRVRIGPLELGPMPPGTFRELDSSEVDALREAAGIPKAKEPFVRRLSGKDGSRPAPPGSTPRSPGKRAGGARAVRRRGEDRS